MNAISSYERKYKESADDVICGEMVRHATGVITYKCFYCQLKFLSGIDFEAHVVDHFLVVEDDDAIVTAADICESISIECSPVADTTGPAESSISCPCCSEKFACQGLRDQHRFQKTIAYSKCPLCPAYFENRLHRMHHRVLHRLPPEKRFSCSHCQRPFDSNDSLYEHIHEDRPPPQLTESVKQLNQLPPIACVAKLEYECDLCGGKFHSKIRLKKHLANHVTSKAIKSFQCNQCDKSYMYNSSLREHRKLHSGQKPTVICHQCGKTYAKNTFNKHLREFHERFKQFVCDDCGDAFFTMHLLNDHVRAQHTLERPYACNTLVCGKVCPKSFTSAKLLAAHVGSHSGAQFQCRYCERMFNHRTNRWVHEKRKHLHFID